MDSSPAYPGTYPLGEPLFCRIMEIFRQDPCSLASKPGGFRLKLLSAASKARAIRLDSDNPPERYRHWFSIASSLLLGIDFVPV